MNNPKEYYLLFFLALLIPLSTYSQDIYVAKNGNDTNTGTIDSPYLTIAKAAAEAVAGNTVVIREGTYEETLLPANSGTAGNPIVFTSFPGEKVIITAMEALSGWTKDTGNVYKTTTAFDLGDENFVINGSQALDLARWPNNIDGDPYTMDSRRNDGGTGDDVLTNARMDYNQGIPNFDWSKGGSLHFYGDRPGKGWLCWRARIKSSTTTSVTFDMSLPNGLKWVYSSHSTGGEGEFFLQGIREALDYQNEWFFNSGTNTLYVQLPNGAVPVDGEVSMRRRRLTANLNGRSNITLKNIAFFGGSIDINGNNNRLEGVTNLWGNAILGITTNFTSGSQSVRIRGNGNVIDHCNIGFGSGTGVFDQGNNTIINNSYIHNFCQLGNYDAPLNSRGSNGGKYTNSTITRGGRDAIQAVGSNIEVAYNDVSYSNLMADDCALFYYSGPDGMNTIPTADLNTEIHHNWFHDAASHGDKFKAAGIYLDTNPKGFLVHHNVVWNTEWTAVQMNWNARNVDIFNNTFFKNQAIMGAWHAPGTSFDDIRVWNNLGDQQSTDMGGNQESEATWEPQSDQKNNLVSKPSFMDWDANNFRLKEGSLAVDAGRVISNVSFAGRTIDVTSGTIGPMPDVGAYEFGGIDWKPGIDWDLNNGSTGEGCFGLPGENCAALPENDADKDGVDDANDQCPDTPEGDTVDVTGCTIFTLPSDNFSVLSTGESCRDSKNGSITITAKENLDYTAAIQENSASSAFTQNVMFSDLGQGTYTVCITIGTVSAFEQCFTVAIDAPQALSVLANVNAQQKEVSLDLNGSDLYRIELNNTVFMTDKSNITLELKNGKNELVVKTSKDCQGIFKKTISIPDDIYVFPNPFGDKVNIAVPNNISAKDISWELYSYQGKLIKQSNQSSDTTIVTINMANIASGSYIIKIKTPVSIIYKQLIRN